MTRALPLILLLLAAPAAAKRGDAIDDRFAKADQLLERGQPEAARDALDDLYGQLKADDARVVRYHERTGAAWLREGQAGRARASFTAALKAAQRLTVDDDSAAKAYAGMGLCLRREKNDEYALKFFKKALSFYLDEGTRMFVEDQIREIKGEPPVAAR